MKAARTYFKCVAVQRFGILGFNLLIQTKLTWVSMNKVDIKAVHIHRWN